SNAQHRCEPLLQRVSGAGNSPTKFLESMLDRIIAHVHRAEDTLRKIARDAHTIKCKSGIQTAAREFRMNCGEIVVSSIERMFRFALRRLFPNAITRDLTPDLCHEN